jgi:hypothetical protein
MKYYILGGPQNFEALRGRSSRTCPGTALVGRAVRWCVGLWMVSLEVVRLFIGSGREELVRSAASPVCWRASEASGAVAPRGWRNSNFELVLILVRSTLLGCVGASRSFQKPGRLGLHHSQLQHVRVLYFVRVCTRS